MRLKQARFGQLAVLISAGAATLYLAWQNHADPTRCPEGLVPAGARCCGTGQSLNAGVCSGRALRCASNMDLDTSGHCVARAARVFIAGGVLKIDTVDWEPRKGSEATETKVRAFLIDKHEVTRARYAECVARGACAAKDADLGRELAEPGLPMTSLEPEAAARFCTFAGGSLASGEQWLFAAATSKGFKYPWGPSGLVCRRAAYGLERGPCSHGAQGPDLVGARPDGCGNAGVCDLVGNVAEWTAEAAGFVVRGGSFRSTLATELKSGSFEPATHGAPHIGFRCVYAAAVPEP